MRPIDPRRAPRSRVLSTGTPQSTALAKRLRARFKRGPTEHVEQAALAYWVRTHTMRFPELENFTAVPHAEQSKAQAAKKWAEGVSKGYPDVLLDVARGGFFGLRIELKRSSEFGKKKGEPRPEQRAWHERLAGHGYCVAVCWGWEPARDVLLWYLALPVRRWTDPDWPAPTPTLTHTRFIGP